MPTLSPEELLNDFDALLDRVEAGEEFTITVSGEPVATLGPVRRYWVDGSVLEELAKFPVDPSYMRDIEDFDIELRDPWADQ